MTELVWQRLLKVVVDALKRGPKKREAIIEEAEAGGFKKSYKTVDRVLRALKDAKLIDESEDGIYKLIKDYQEFRSDEYQIRLEHSKQLKEQFKKSLKSQETFDMKLHSLNAIQKSEYFENFLQHLEDGYNDTFNLFKKWEEIKAEKDKKNEKFTNEIKKIASKEGFIIHESLSDSDNTSRVISVHIFNSIKRYSKFAGKRKPKIGVDLEINEEGVYDPLTMFSLAKNTGLKEELEKFIDVCISSDSLKRLYSELEPTEAQEEEIGINLGQEISIIFKAVDLNYPLKGSCNACKYKILK